MKPHGTAIIRLWMWLNCSLARHITLFNNTHTLFTQVLTVLCIYHLQVHNVQYCRQRIFSQTFRNTCWLSIQRQCEQ